MGFCFDFQGKVFGPVDNGAPLFCIAGPCALESRAHALEVASALREIFAAAHMPFLYKSSFDKANRSSGASYRGVGMAEGLSILADVRERVGVPVLTDVHTPEQAAPVAEVADMLQTPTFLCRQTDLIAAVAATGKPVNIKKGQFLAPWEMENVLQKARATGNEYICLCERGTSFGYGSLVVDMRGLEVTPMEAGVDTQEDLERVRAVIAARRHAAALEKLKHIRLIVTNVDGVLTDGSLYYGSEGECLKRFNVRDGLAIKLLQEAGIQVAVLSERDCPALRARLQDLGIKETVLGSSGKRTALVGIMERCGVQAEKVAFIGVDIPDIEAFGQCGVSITIGDAADYIKRKADLVLQSGGGQGVLREIIDVIMSINYI